MPIDALMHVTFCKKICLKEVTCFVQMFLLLVALRISFPQPTHTTAHSQCMMLDVM